MTLSSADSASVRRALRSLKLIPDDYELTEEIMAGDGVFTANGRSSLVNAVVKLLDKDTNNVAIYTCGTYIFTIGCKYGQYFLMDTHSINQELGWQWKRFIESFLPYPQGFVSMAV